MMKTRVSKRRLVRCLGVLATAALMLSAASSQRAEALSPINPGTVPAAKYSSDGLVTEVRGGHGGGGFHGGGGRGFHGGGFRSFHGGHFHHRGFAFRHRFHHRHVYFAPSYGYPRCRVIWTYHGPRRICHYRHWRHHRYHRAYW